jgi:capsule biosynthesis phosphatase
MRIIIDLDGTICHLKKSDQTYADLKPLPGAVEKLNALKNDGWYIVIQTARNMATQESNIGKVIKNIGKITLDWLEEFEVPYDEIYFGKPNGQVYLDDRAHRFEGWDKIDSNELKIIAKEK